MGFAFAAVTGFLLFLIGERVLLWCARKQFALVIHVNGTRGKSTVTRMIHALLRSQGMEVFGKTTGSAARFLLPDGTERPILRFGPANVREQRNVMLMAAFSKKLASRRNRALVLECNAVQEELQYISMRWLKPDITIITNVREDHVDELGKAEQAARIFGAAIPDGSVLVTSEGGYIDIWETAAKQKKLRLCYVDSREAGDCAFPENTACVLGVADYLEIDRAWALKAIADYTPDAGAFGVYSWKANSRLVFFADARAANDIESTKQLFAAALQAIKPDTDVRRILLLINREDRPDRSWRFMQYLINQHRELGFSQYLCLGHAPLAFRNAMKREGINHRLLHYIKDLDRALEEFHDQPTYIFAMGNYGGKGAQITQWLETKRHEPDFRQISGPLFETVHK